MRPQIKLAYTVVKTGLLPLGWVSAKNIFSTDIQNFHLRVFGETLANVLSHAGPVWTKLGQILSSRDDLLPQVVCQKLEVLYKDQKAMPKKMVRSILKNNFGDQKPFEEIDWNPLGVGSIGQVHRARLKTGESVVIKILRPKIKLRLEEDVRSLRSLTEGLSKIGISEGLRFFAEKIIDDLEKAFETETDLENERRSLQRFAHRYKRSQNFYIPKVFPEVSNSDVLVMEEIKGTSFVDLKKSSDLEGKRKKEIAEKLLKEVLVQILEDGDFHADPHAGNLYYMEDGRVAFIDLGLTGRFQPEDRIKLSRAVKSFLDRDPNKVIEALLEFGQLSESFNLENFKAEIVLIVKDNKTGVKDYASGKEGVPLEVFVEKLFRAARKHGVFLPSDTTLLIKTLLTIEGVARGLHPELNLLRTTAPVVISALVPRWLKNPFRSR